MGPEQQVLVDIQGIGFIPVWVGSGDIFIGAGIGALLGGWRNMVACLFFTYISGAIISIMLILSKRKTFHDRIGGHLS